MQPIIVSKIVQYLEKEVLEVKGKTDFKVDSFKSLKSMLSNSVSFAKSFDRDLIQKINRLYEVVIICSAQTPFEQLNLDKNAFIIVKNPRLSFIKLLTLCKGFKRSGFIHSTATVSPKAIIGQEVFIGPNCIIGECEIGEGSIIKGNAYIGDNVKIGKNCLFHPGVIIGGDGFGFEKDEETGEYYKFPHIGGVIIGNEVEVGANTCIDRATLDHTVISNKVKIDNLVHIAHNVFIGENTLIIANSMIGGSTKIGSNTWVAPSVSALNGISIGQNCFIGIGSTVMRDVPDNVTVVGSPARDISEFKKLMKFEAKIIRGTVKEE